MPPTFIINLKIRPDRKESKIKEFMDRVKYSMNATSFPVINTTNKMKFSFYSIIALVIPFNVCCKNNVSVKPVNDSGSTIVLIFENIPIYKRTYSPFPNVKYEDHRHQITILDSLYQYNYNLNSPKDDTITLLPKSKSIILSFLYYPTHIRFDYIINRGDTIVFNFKNSKPYATLKNNYNGGFINYEYDRYLNDTLYGQYTPYEIYRTPFIIAKSANDIFNKEQETKQSYYLRAHDFLKNELNLLNNYSVQNNKSDAIFDLLRDKFTYQIAEMDFEQHKLSTDSLNAILERNKQKAISPAYAYFLSFLEKVSDSVNVNTSNLIKYENGNGIDYREVYDRTSKWSVINDFYKKLLLYKYLKGIGGMFSVADLQKYLTKFSSFSNDTILVKNIKDEFLIADNPNNLSKDSLYMADAKGKLLSLQTFLSLNRGKIIYIDFWASWCVPCRKEMKYAEKLRESFKNKDVVFAYFSVDKSKSDWMEASNDEKLNKVQYNYILSDPESSAFLKTIDFGPIPRYLLYDKQGKLVHKTAPPPSSEEALNIITEYLSK